MTSDPSSNAQIGVRLRWARENAGLSQGQVAKKMSLHRPTISQVEAGDRAVKPKEILEFAELYDVDARWIVAGDSTLPSDTDPRIALAARELSKLDPDDLDKIVRLIKVLRTPGDKAGG